MIESCRWQTFSVHLICGHDGKENNLVLKDF